VTTTSRLETVELTPRIGVEIRADADAVVSGAHTAQLLDLLEQRGVVLFREFGLDDRQQVAFARTLGEVIDQGVDNIYKVTLDATITPTADYLHGTFFWHIDGTVDDIPSKASLLSAHRLATTGGQTEWANTYAAFADLSDDEKQAFAALRVVHAQEVIQRKAHEDYSEEDFAEVRSTRPPRSHPLVWTHRSGRKLLVLGLTASHIEGIDPDESRALLDRLQAWSTQPEYIYHHDWSVGDLVIWDNPGTMHRVVPYAVESGRMMHRTTLAGEEPIA
jgi:alpha-ketoglutarate-dependent taurine dioxygenase